MMPPERAGAVSVAASRWVATAASIWVQCTSGASYCFGIYSPLLKSSQAYDQSTLDAIAFSKDVGANVGVLSGVLYFSSASNAAPKGARRCGVGRGPWMVIAAGAAQCFAGYFLMWLSVTGSLPRPPVALMCLYMFLAAQAQTFFNTVDVVTAVRNFPENRGTVVGIMKGFLGLSGAILIQIYKTIYVDEPSKFILMLALLPSVLPLLLMPFINVDETRSGDDMRYLNRFSAISLIIAGYIMVQIIWENISPMKSFVQVTTLVILLLLLLATPLHVALTAYLRSSAMSTQPSDPERTPLIDDATLDSERPRDSKWLQEKSNKIQGEVSHHGASPELPDSNACGSSSPRGSLPGLPRRGEDLDVLEALRSYDFWLLFVAMSCGMGSGLATVNNISQIGAALAYGRTEISTMVSLWSIWNFLGRFGGGYISDYFMNARGTSRPLFMALTLGTMSIGHLIISFGFPGALYLGSVLVGICYGCQWSLMPTITSELFGVMNMGTLFNTISIASPLGSYILSVRIVGHIYDMEAASSGMSTCIGTHCFRLSFVIMACASLFGSLVALALFFHTRKFYQQVIVARHRRSSML